MAADSLSTPVSSRPLPRRGSSDTAMTPASSRVQPATDGCGKDVDPSALPDENDKPNVDPEGGASASASGTGADAGTATAAAGDYSEKPALTLRAHSLTDPALRPMLKGLLKGLGPMIALLCVVVIWAILPIYVRLMPPHPMLPPPPPKKRKKRKGETCRTCGILPGAWAGPAAFEPC